MDGLLVVRDPGVVRTTRILPNSNEADFIHRRSSVGKSAKFELSSLIFKENGLTR